MRVLVVGSGGREHALAWAIAASPLVDVLYCAPGNAGIAEEAECVAIGATDIAGLVGFCRRERIDFVVVGPEAPLVLGLVDALEAEGIPAFGPSAAAAALEGSKAFAKDLCVRAQIPTAAYRRFRDPATAKAFIASHGAPIVVKADGLAGGKGVTVASDLDAAYQAVDAALVERRFDEAGREIVVEDCLTGEEASFFALVDGKTALPLASAQDYKRVGDGDTGPNTGGMGSCSPAPCLTPALEGSVMERIILPTVAAMEREGRPFKGVLYAGLMLTEAGPDAPRVQCPSRRPGSSGADDAADERSAAGADRRARRGAEIDRSALARRACGMRRDGGPRAIPTNPSMAARSAASKPRRPTPRSRSSTPEPAAMGAGSSPMAAGCSGSRHSAPISRAPATAPTPRSIASSGPRASAGATSALRADFSGRRGNFVITGRVRRSRAAAEAQRPGNAAPGR